MTSMRDNTEREIRVTLLDGSEIIMNTGDKVLFQASRPGAIPLSVEADTIIDDVLATLEKTERRNTELHDELTEASNEAMRYEEEARTWEDRHYDLYRAYGDQDRQLAEAQQTISRLTKVLEKIKSAGAQAGNNSYYHMANDGLGEGAKES